MVWLSYFLSCSNYCSLYCISVKERQNPHCNRADPALIQVYTIYMIIYINFHLPPPLFESGHNLSTVHFWAIMVHIEVFWAYFHKSPDFAPVCQATWCKESSTVTLKQEKYHTFFYGAKSAFSQWHPPLFCIDGIPYTSPKKGMMSNKVYVWWRLNFLRGYQKVSYPLMLLRLTSIKKIKKDWAT